MKIKSRTKKQSFRCLDFDDLHILVGTLNGETQCSMGKRLSLSSAAVTQRVRKIESALNVKVVEEHRAGLYCIITEDGRKLGQLSKKILELVEAYNKAER